MHEVKLTTAQMASFVARGFLAFEGLVPDALNQAALEELGRILRTWGTPERPLAPVSGQPLSAIYPEPSAIGQVLRQPEVAGAITSLVGPEPVFDHDFIHWKKGGDLVGQPLHQDAMVEPGLAFDIQVFYFPTEVTPDGGGTGFVPGTHLRRVHETDVGRYLHMAGERQWSGPAGSVLIFHSGLWHRGMPNPSAIDRTMFKIRLNPTVPQVRHWDLSDFDARHNSREDHVFATFRRDSVAALLRRRERWMGEADYRLELANRTRLWRYLSDDPDFDVDWYLTRTEGHHTLSAS